MIVTTPNQHLVEPEYRRILQGRMLQYRDRLLAQTSAMSQSELDRTQLLLVAKMADALALALASKKPLALDLLLAIAERVSHVVLAEHQVATPVVPASTAIN